MVPYSMVRRLITEAVLEEDEAVVYVKGHEKREWLADMLDTDDIIIETLDAHYKDVPFDRVDLFASTINAKNEFYVSWLPDPGSWAIDAFTLSWINFNFYAFPPFISIPKVLRKIVDERATGVLLVPWLPSQLWFPLFVRLLFSESLILPPSHSLLSSPVRKPYQERTNLSLAAERLSGDLSNPRRHHHRHWLLS
ncbi:hypothetical protein ALC57_16592 [Trachymyrmex cornetzi]|uniref:Uncharacterized protein n=1 Tax=Trachymyrmex cornetzi TaxID=471704 RepID=A0A151IUW6_9HYME|nr:hypothetical protein ALC57_16592 [Trachymyrmex cornetzi]